MYFVLSILSRPFPAPPGFDTRVFAGLFRVLRFDQLEQDPERDTEGLRAVAAEHQPRIPQVI